MRGFLRFWRLAVTEAASVGWAVFGVVSTVLPDVVAVIHKFLPNIEVFGFVQWVINHQVRARLIAATIAVTVYLLYAPYRMYREQVTRLQSATIVVQSKKEREYIRDRLSAFLLRIEKRLEDLKKLEAIDVAMFNKETLEWKESDVLISEITDFVLKKLGFSYASEFLSNTGFDAARTKTWDEYSRHIESMKWRATRLKRIIEEYKLD
jgi:hypothetical protein